MTQTATHTPIPQGCNLCEHLSQYLDAPGYKCAIGWRLVGAVGIAQDRPEGCYKADDASGWLLESRNSHDR